MENIGFLILASVALPLIWAVASALTASGVQNKFAKLGDLRGLTKGEIFHAVGPPNSISVVGEGKEVLQWQVTGYHIALIFQDGFCEGVTHEHRAM